MPTTRRRVQRKTSLAASDLSPPERAFLTGDHTGIEGWDSLHLSELIENRPHSGLVKYRSPQVLLDLHPEYKNEPRFKRYLKMTEARRTAGLEPSADLPKVSQEQAAKMVRDAKAGRKKGP